MVLFGWRRLHLGGKLSHRHVLFKNFHQSYRGLIFLCLPNGSGFRSERIADVVHPVLILLSRWGFLMLLISFGNKLHIRLIEIEAKVLGHFEYLHFPIDPSILQDNTFL